MSYEGYVQKICEQGHLFIEDCYHDVEENCPVCKSKWAYQNSINQTNDNGYPYKFEILNDGMSEPCDKCNRKEKVASSIYKIPTEEDIKNYHRAQDKFYEDEYEDNYEEV